MRLPMMTECAWVHVQTTGDISGPNPECNDTPCQTATWNAYKKMCTYTKIPECCEYDDDWCANELWLLRFHCLLFSAFASTPCSASVSVHLLLYDGTPDFTACRVRAEQANAFAALAATRAMSPPATQPSTNASSLPQGATTAVCPMTTGAWIVVDVYCTSELSSCKCLLLSVLRCFSCLTTRNQKQLAHVSV